MPVQIPTRDVMETPKKRVLRRKNSIKVKVKSAKKVSTAPLKSPSNIAKVHPMPAILNLSKRRHPSSDMNSDVEDRISTCLNRSEPATNIEMAKNNKIRRRNPSQSTKSASEALLALKDSARIFSQSQTNSLKKREDIVSPFLKLPKSLGNTEISNVTNISHIFSSPNVEKSEKSQSKLDKKCEKRQSQSDSECEKIEDPELSYPLPSKRPKSADSKIRLEDFLTAKDFKAKRNDYQAQIDKLKAQNDEIEAKTEDLKAKMADFKSKTEEVTPKNEDFKPLLAMLECSSCKKLPKNDISRPTIYGCSNGHLVCQNCVDIVQKCPLCSEKEVNNKQAFAEHILNKIFPSIKKPTTKCQFDLCKAEMKKVEDLKDHEKFCIHREVPCPSTHRGACDWKGPLSKLIEHCKEKQCVQVAFDDTWFNTNYINSFNNTVNSVFKANLGDFPSNEKSVFERNDVTTHWKPTLLLSKKLLNLWCHIVIQRDSQGFWKLMAYSMLPKECTEKIRVKITVGDPDNGRSFSFSGKLTSYETSSAQAIREGNFLHLHDAHVKPFKLSGEVKSNTLFDYSIEVDAEAKLVSMLNLRSQRISMNSTATTIERKTITDKDIPKMPKLTPKPAARFNVTFDTNNKINMGTPKFDVKVKMEPTEVQID